MISFRNATVADAPAIDALFRHSFMATFGHLYAPEDLAAFFARFTRAAWEAELADPALAVWLAEQDGAALGFVKLGPLTLPVEPRGPAIELRQLYLTDDAKGTHVAPFLMAWALHTARERGAGELFLSVYVENERAKRFYARYGFEDVGRYAFMVGAHEDEDRLMRLAL